MVNSINMPVSRERMEKYQNRHLRQIEHASKQVEARESKSKNNNMRRVWLERQTNLNYRNECDRIRDELSNRRIPFKSRRQLDQREADFKKTFFFR